jgi:hypothetical protein
MQNSWSLKETNMLSFVEKKKTFHFHYFNFSIKNFARKGDAYNMKSKMSKARKPIKNMFPLYFQKDFLGFSKTTPSTNWRIKVFSAKVFLTISTEPSSLGFIHKFIMICIKIKQKKMF